MSEQPWTRSELDREFAYRVTEYLGICIDDRDPTPEQAAAADRWAKMACDKLRVGEAAKDLFSFGRNL